jgi:lipopolysaccharide/colanic/teichoic acid biosynthesis glycosyltransferase
LQGATRETDVTGWYTANAVIGVMFTEVVLENNAVLSTILARIDAVVRNQLDTEQFSQVNFSFHVYPDDWNSDDPDGRATRPCIPIWKNGRLEPGDAGHQADDRRSGKPVVADGVVSRIFVHRGGHQADFAGPILFRQKRIGEHGTPFTFLKFRSMYMNNDPSEHKEYVRQLIAGQAEKKSNGSRRGGERVQVNQRSADYAGGRVLRRSSLDELPQLINVLRGEMSLVGPRPPVPYEVEAYATWHRRRLLEAKPGITGLWQVYGRSRVEFDDMVRLDFRYARDCSPLLDLKILLQTPKAVMSGDGACYRSLKPVFTLADRS